MQQRTNIRVVGFAAGVTTLIVWVLGFYHPEFMAAAPTGAEAALTGVITALVCYFLPDTSFEKRGPTP